MQKTMLVFACFVLIGGMELVNGNVLSRASCVNTTRQGWGARKTRSSQHMDTPVGLVFIHHSTGKRCFNWDDCVKSLRGIQNYHMDTRGWHDIGYSFLVGEDGNVYEGRGWNRVGAHTRGYNAASIGICVMGNFTSILPNAAALKAVKELIACGVEKKKIIPDYKLFGHKDGRKSVTTSPGDKLYALIRTWPHYDDQGPPLDGYWKGVNFSSRPTPSDALYYTLLSFCLFSVLNQLTQVSI